MTAIAANSANDAARMALINTEATDGVIEPAGTTRLHGGGAWLFSCWQRGNAGMRMFDCFSPVCFRDALIAIVTPF